MTENDIRHVCERFLKRYPGLSNFEIIIASSDKLPTAIRENENHVAGYVRGSETLFICQDRIEKPAEIEQCLRHEVFGHAVMDSLPRNVRNSMLDDMHYALCKDPEFRRKYDNMIATEYGGEISHNVLEEYFSRVAEGRIEINWSEKLIGNIREIIRSAFNKVNIQFPFNDLDVRYFLGKEIGRIASGEHVLSSQNTEALQRNEPFLARLEEFESRVSLHQSKSRLGNTASKSPVTSKPTPTI